MRSRSKERIIDTHHLVDPQLEPILGLMPELTFTDESLQAMRAGLAQAPLPEVDLTGLEVTERHVPGLNGAPDVRVLVTRPTAPTDAKRSALLWIHGGGYILGRAEMNGPLVAAVASQLDSVVVSVDYRLAPETPSPGPVEDCYAALQWLHREAGSLGIDTARVAIGGESAGGGLAAALAVLARDRGEHDICHALLIYPMLDDRTAVETDPNPVTGQYVWNRAANLYGWTALLGTGPGGDDVSPYAAAARTKDLAGLPPTFVGVGALDLFLDENVEYAARLLRAGVPTELHVYPGAFHGFFSFEGPEVGASIRQDAMRSLRRALAA